MRGKHFLLTTWFCLSVLSGFSQQTGTNQGDQNDKLRLEELQKAQEQILEQLQELRKDITAAQLAGNARLQLEKRLSALELAQGQLQARLEELTQQVSSRDVATGDPGAAEAPAGAPAEATVAPATPQPQAGPASSVQPGGLTPLDLGSPDSSGQVTSGTAFNPAISVIPDILYYNDNESGEGGELFSRADGFAVTETIEGHDHGGELSPGFNLRELEVTFSGAVDPYVDVMAIIAAGADSVELEEVYGRTRSLPAGLQLKFGKFFSDIGYINSQHPHQWDFVNQNLAYQFLVGGNLNETGVQLSWLPNLPLYVRLGAEAFQSDNSALGRYVGPSDETPFFSRRGGPRLFDGFVKVAPDFGYNHALQAGFFGGSARRHQEVESDAALEGSTWFAGTDWVYKYDSPREYGKGDFTLQGEYLYRVKDLEIVDSADSLLIGQPTRYSQDAFYIQGIYGFAERFTAAARFDAAGLTNRLERGLLIPLELNDSRRASFNLTFNPTHFSRVRLQYDRSALSVGGIRGGFNQIFLQAQFSLGVHGAHKF